MLTGDRDASSRLVTERIRSHPRVEVREVELLELPEEGIAVIAAGPLTSDALAPRVEAHCGGSFSFFGAALFMALCASI